MDKKLEKYMYWQRVSMSTMNVALNNLKNSAGKAAYQVNKFKRAVHAMKVRARKMLANTART